MKVATLFSSPCPEVIVNAMIDSVRRHMDCEIVQLTDLTTPKLDKVDSVQRIEGDICSSILARHLSTLSGNVLYLDYDIIVRKDVSHVFSRKFDLAITKRTDEDIHSAPFYMVTPNNTGVMFSRSTAFWKKVVQRYDSRIDNASWMKFQIVVAEMMNTQKQFKFLQLDQKYNYTPKTRDEELSAYIVHYKGSRKAWMVKPEDEEKAMFGTVMTENMMRSQEGKLAISEDHPYYESLKKNVPNNSL